MDDIATNRVILRAKLAASYYDVIQAENGAEALQKTATEQPDIILLDVLMPDMSGFEVCRQLKADPATAHIPVVMVTALLNPQDRLRGLECEADDFLSKPINDLALFSRVRNLLRAKFMFDELRLRDRTTQELGLTEVVGSGVEISPDPGRVVIIPPDLPTGTKWEALLSSRSSLDVHLCPSEAEAIAITADDLPDVFLIHARLGAYGDGLRLVSHLRSRPNSRHVAVILVVPDGDQEKAAKGLDLGASDYIFDPFDPSELTVRLNSQIRRKQISEQLRNNVTDSLRLAVLDPLTGLYNRRYAKQHIERVRERSKDTQKSFALMLLDIDKFKSVNDTHGHSAGDQVLKEFARRIQENLRGIDLVSRIGGEEFLVAMPDTTEEQARKASERLRQVIEETDFPYGADSDGLQITVSIGVTLGDVGTVIVDELIEQADQALYASKSDGRNMVTLFNSAA